MPLRFVPRYKSVVLGLVSTKVSELEDRAALERRLDEASKFVALDRLGVSPQCGFASLDTGNPVTAETQNRKLQLVCDLACEIWGET
jgi:5-methyltetrahydropteroyltriglutamate--homocysteine methyltransferase